MPSLIPLDATLGALLIGVIISGMFVGRLSPSEVHLLWKSVSTASHACRLTSTILTTRGRIAHPSKYLLLFSGALKSHNHMRTHTLMILC
jgi:hypothetical protein